MKPENTNNPICSDCDCRTRKHDKRNNVYRYYCPKCKKAFIKEEDRKYKYTRHSKQVLSLLFNVLENNFFGEKDLEKAFKHNNYDELSKKVQLNTDYADKINVNKFSIGCYNPKLLVCVDEKDITFIQIPPFDKDECKTFKFNDNKQDRVINIIDNKNLGEANKKNNVPFKKIKR